MPETADNVISGRDILRTVHDTYAEHRDAMRERGTTAVIIRVAAADDAPAGWRARMLASKTSAEQKVRNFNLIGMRARHVVLAPDVTPGVFADEIARGNDDPSVTAIIVQQPVPARLQQFVEDIAPAKDIDALTLASRYPVCATAEGIWRVTRPLVTDQPSIAVVGAQGFVGRGVVARLNTHDHTPMQLDLGDDLARVADVDVVISVTGQPDLLDDRHLRAHHRLVVDSGFYPRPDGSIGSDVNATATGIPQHITPVPGGIGPVEMAVLIERALHADLQLTTPAWTYDGPDKSHEPKLTGPAAAAKLAAAAFPGPTRVPPAARPGSPAAPTRPQPHQDRGTER